MPGIAIWDKMVYQRNPAACYSSLVGLGWNHFLRTFDPFKTLLNL